MKVSNWGPVLNDAKPRVLSPIKGGRKPADCDLW